ncbi:CDP-diacylglycerol--serine O-phosphatidyltransferase [Ruficoccus amylovorans]|uniref:CDP-diacylglycerol--serine O-phosphatidyltransferase n=1 Tax=Ruficoccus amylovorans TaxID=1804625 RepID=A0A842HIX8_9BACT|nr:CDP-diacylglycerol--serine O-phosphatidyltransferase [Ruficoccus amylovorans]MBC2595554.1 CDP-diacylglycerol--serine O-phosphatidyltransferase [Ruficoccus amylovorans]
MSEQPTEKQDNLWKDTAEAGRIYILPNLFTAGNLFFGFLAIIWCIQGKYAPEDKDPARLFTEAVFFILGAAFCDALDGRVARLGGRESLFGKEFDSIADVVSFGMAPALMMFFLILDPTNGYPFFRQIGWLIGFIYLLCAGVRLARFNVLTNPYIPPGNIGSAHARADDFLGLPAPMAAGTVASLVLVILNFDLKAFSLLLPPLMLLIAWLMISLIPYPSFKHVGWQTHLQVRYFIGLIILVALMFQFWRFSFAIVFLLYIFWGLFKSMQHRRRDRKNRGADEPEAPAA